MIYLDKVLSVLIFPLGTALVLALLVLVVLLLQRRRLGVGLLLVAVGWLTVWSLPVVSDAVRLSLENRFEYQAAEALPRADAIVVLGGGMRPGPPDWPYPDLGQAADRVWHAARLYHAGRAPVIVASGGMLPWQGDYGSEAESMRVFLSDLDVPESAVILETRSMNTRENAIYTAEILQAQGYNSILLVTSALHMRRALAAFRAHDIAAVPAPTDFEVMPRPNHLLRWLPDAEALADSTRAIKEYVGYLLVR